MRSKKLVALLAALFVGASALAGCGGGEGEQEEQQEQQQDGEQEEEEEEEEEEGGEAIRPGPSRSLETILAGLRAR